MTFDLLNESKVQMIGELRKFFLNELLLESDFEAL